MFATGRVLLLAFGAFGLLWGAWQAALPDVVDRFRLSSGPLGAMLTLGFAISLPFMIGAGRLLDRVGPRLAITVPGAVMAAALVVVATASEVATFAVALVALIVASGAYDVAINGASMADATWSRPARLTLLHGAFSGGGAVGALATGALIGSGVPYTVTHLGVAAIVLGGAGLALVPRWPRRGLTGDVPRGIALRMLPLAGLAALAFLAEGSMETWSAIYLRDVLGAAAFVGALGPATFHLAMLGGRLVGAGIAGRMGPAATLLVAGSMLLVGMAVALLVSEPAVAIAAIAIAALGASFVVPVVVSLAASRAGPYAGRAASYVLTLGYGGFMVGPSLVGIGGELVGLRAALAIIPLSAVLVIAASRSRIASAQDGGS